MNRAFRGHPRGPALLALAVLPLFLPALPALARPVRGGLGGPASGAGVRPGAGWGAPGAGVTRAGGVGRWNPAWAGGGYWAARPWSAGWYQVRPVAWTWWGPSSVAWGVTGLATAAAITSAVNTAASQQSTVIVVPQSSIQLDYGSVQAVAPSGVTFAYAVKGGAYGWGQAECRQGLLNGMAPGSVEQAQLLNAVCQIAYGGG